ncbi:hypothetical protein Cpar_1843 [Chlorobaculum parvum NCIB 8327]|uniref:HEPN domain-containing protein n=1 Tax=Chlorobaculum parvum (strain DSM 263 / NCIMB 8327) TaxID=517417 RepID=B3QQN2_CHLP8|nr:HEPN domain-containing protein [Chlorobaculum parvum]ACF12235.1 hypothetical protein Cpar_1843 [Chlorobaculum parvum NCIB 8327]
MKIHLGTVDLAGKGPGTFSMGTFKLSKDYRIDIFSSARQFLAAAEFCLNNGEIIEGKPMLLVPGVVCAAFACELCLKWLIYNETEEEVKGHRLTELYGLLSQDMQNHISAFQSAFSDFLQRNDDVFIKARYHHESELFAFRETEILQFAQFLVSTMESKNESA